jgi:hypothetical protein
MVYRFSLGKCNSDGSIVFQYSPETHTQQRRQFEIVVGTVNSKHIEYQSDENFDPKDLPVYSNLSSVVESSSV